MPSRDPLKRRDQVSKPLVRRDVAEEQDRLFTAPDAQSLPCLVRSEICVRNSIVDPIRDDSDCRFTYSKLRAEFTLHLFRMNKDMIGKPILDSQAKAIDQRIGRVPPASINIVRGEGDLLPQEFVVEQQQSSIEELKLVIP